LSLRATEAIQCRTRSKKGRAEGKEKREKKKGGGEKSEWFNCRTVIARRGGKRGKKTRSNTGCFARSPQEKGKKKKKKGEERKASLMAPPGKKTGPAEYFGF